MVIGRRVIVLAVVVLQLGFIVRGYSSDHKEFAFQMFPESSTWRADVVRVTADGAPRAGRAAVVRLPLGRARAERGLSYPAVAHHADAGLDNQLAFLRSALD